MSITALKTTTLTPAIDANTQAFTVGSTTDITVGSILAIGAEYMLVQVIPVAGSVQVTRGWGGTLSSAHSAGSLITAGAGPSFGPASFGPLHYDGRVTLARQSGSVFPPYILPVGSTTVDPNTGFEYCLVDAQSALVINEWCVIDGNGLASQLAAASIGRVGIVVEAVSGSDTLVLVLVAGTYATARTSSDFVSSQMPMAGVGEVVPYLTSVGGNLIWRAKATGAASGTSSIEDSDTAPVYIDHPWVQGVGFWMNS